MDSNIGVVIPFYYLSNNFKSDVKILQKTINSVYQYTKNIIVVNDGTPLSLINNAKLIKHDYNLGKGVAIRTGLDFLLSNKKIKFIVEIDADNDQDPKEIIKFIDAFNNGVLNKNCLMIGDRYAAPEMKNTNNYRKSVNQIQNSLFTHFDFNLRDAVSGFRGYSKSFAKEILQNSKSKGFGIATEEVILAYLTETPIQEIPLEYAKPRKEFTKAYKLEEVIEGIIIHKTKLKKRGKLEIINFLENIKLQLEQKTNPITFNLGKKEFNFKYNENSYGLS